MEASLLTIVSISRVNPAVLQAMREQLALHEAEGMANFLAIKDLQERIAVLEVERDQAQERLAASEAAREQQQAALENMQARIDAMESRIADREDRKKRRKEKKSNTRTDRELTPAERANVDDLFAGLDRD